MTHRLALPDLRASASPGRVGLGAGLVRAECLALAAAVRRLPPGSGGGWFTREHRDRDGGGVIALVLPRDEWDPRLPLFLIWRGEGGLLHLCMGRSGGEAVDLGRFAAIAALIASVEREVRRPARG